jgi:hypothetical protein
MTLTASAPSSEEPAVINIIPDSIAMIMMTTKSSTSVKPLWVKSFFISIHSPPPKKKFF